MAPRLARTSQVAAELLLIIDRWLDGLYWNGITL